MSTYTTHRIIQGKIGANVARAVPEHPYIPILQSYTTNATRKYRVASCTDERPSSDPPQTTPLMPSSSAKITAAFSPMSSAVEYVFAPMLDGPMDKSAILSPWTPYTLRRGLTTPPRSRGFIPQVPSYYSPIGETGNSLAYCSNTCARMRSEAKNKTREG